MMMKNEERIRNLNTDDLAHFIYQVSEHDKCISTCEEMCEVCDCTEDYCINKIKEWLEMDE